MSIQKRLPWLAVQVISSLFLVSTVYAGVPGPYIGLQLGYGRVQDTGIESNEMFGLVTDALNTNAIALETFTSGVSANGFAGRIFAGFQFNCHWALEMGWNQLPNLPVRAEAVGLNGVTGLAYRAYTSGTLKTNAFDVVMKGILPLPNYFSLYAKLGVAYLESRANESVAVNQAFILYPASDTEVLTRYYPTFGLGISYDITPFTVADLSWSRIQSTSGSSSNDGNVGSTDMITLGLSYNFGYVGYV